MYVVLLFMSEYCLYQLTTKVIVIIGRRENASFYLRLQEFLLCAKYTAFQVGLNEN